MNIIEILFPKYAKTRSALNNPDMQSILKDNNLTIKKINSIGELGSGSSYHIVTTKGEFKARLFPEEKQAVEVEDTIIKHQNIFPKFFGRKGRCILMQWIDSDEKMQHLKYSVDSCRRVGEIAGEIHSRNEVMNKSDKKLQDFHFNKSFDIIKNSGMLSERHTQEVLEIYEKLSSRLEIDIIKELHDLHIGNFVIDKKGNLILVDEEVIGYRPKGLVFAKPIGMNPDHPKLSGWMKTKEQIDAFWEGYHKHASSDFFTKDYQALIYLHRIVRSFSVMIKAVRKNELEKYKEKLILFLDLMKEMK